MTHSLEALRREEAACRRCALYQNATQVVPGEGPPRAALMLVGEQPGDREDLAGKPFVGPAGRILDQALSEARVARDSVFVTNAVKHFKFEQNGKRRLHKRPNADEIDSCHWWLRQERALVRPSVILAMGATAARGVLGRPVVLSQARGKPLCELDGARVMVTIHPSFLLRIKEAGDNEEAYRRFFDDVKAAAVLAGVIRRDS